MTTQQWPDPTMINGLTESETSATASVAGLTPKEAGLPVVAWMTDDGIYPSHDAIPARLLPPAGRVVALACLSDAQAIIDRLADELVIMSDDRDSWRQQASDRTDDAVRFAAERDALKAAQPDPEKVMRLADEYAVAQLREALAAAQDRPTLINPDAAREALRAYLTAKEVK